IDDDENCSVNFLDKLIATFKANVLIPFGFVVNNKELKTKLDRAGHNILKGCKSKEVIFDDDKSFTSAKIVSTPVRTG
ncbi:septum site-determining protein MinC, partial [Francisella tularensis subsp. holarctica]|nr:septum site-determining protein MinC [Francisella tularensis subsp. holarctica]